VCTSCQHGKVKSDCAACNPCPHGKLKYSCAVCKKTRVGQSSAKRIKQEPEIKQEQFTIRGYFGIGD
tara:strand:- start:934 stop:1134 length:201 start_codon:yes stop_codon:yes gene_type:complete